MSIQNLSMQGVAVRAPVRFPLAVVAAAVSLISASTVIASEARVSETIVTATRTETKLDETMADVRVITKEQISSSGGRSLAEILQRFAGAQIVSYGGRGQAQNISFRGSKQVVLLVDGVRFSSATTGEPSLALLPLELIERIEVVHGPASALYGSDAIGGVVQIFTKRGLSAQNSFSPSASVTYGHAGYKDIQGAVLGKHNEWDYSIAANRVIDPKFSVTNAKEPWGAFEADSDYFHQTGINASLGYKINQDWRFESTLTSAVSRVDLDSWGKINPWDKTSSLTAQIKLKGNLLPTWRSSFAISSMEDDQSSYSVGVVNPSYYKTNQYEYSWFNEFDTPLGIAIAGFDRLTQKIDSNLAYSVKSRDVDAYYGGLNGALDKHSWQINLRRDNNSQFGGFNTWGVSYGYQILPGLRGYIARAKAMRAPTFNELYSPWGGGNPLLVPEQSRNNELGFNWQLGQQNFKIVRFDSKISNMISNWPVTNTGARRKGWSLGYGVDVAGWKLAGNYEHLDTHNLKTGERITGRTAEHQGTLSIDKEFGAWNLGANALHVGKRTDSLSGGGKTILNAYTTLDASIQYKIDKEWSVQIRAANLNNREYETAYGYNQRGRAAYLTLKWAQK